MSDEVWFLLLVGRIIVAILAVVLMSWGMVLDVERGQRLPGRALFLAACLMFVLNILSKLVI